MKNNYLNIIGLAYRAGKCAVGEDLIVKSIQNNKAKLVLLASDTGPQTKKKITDKCKFYKVPYRFTDNRETLSQAIGKTHIVAVAILDEGFAEKLNTLLG
jgi:ribosomal protein L7Ae-like RNA K-turn-binding protein